MKVFCIIILRRLKDARDKLTRPEQAGFRPGKGCQEHILTLRLILQQSERFQLSIFIAFIDFVATFNSLIRNELWKIMIEDGVPAQLIEILKRDYESTVTRVRTADGETTEFDVESGVKQGCPLSPILFNYIIDWIMTNSLCTQKGLSSVREKTT